MGGDLNLKEWKGPVCLFLAFSLAGTSVVSARLVSDQLKTFTIAAASLFFALLFLLPVAGKSLKNLRALSAKRLLLFFLQAIFGIFLFRMFLLNGLRYTTSVEAGVITGATPAITALLALVILKESANGCKLTGLLCTVAGILLIQGLMNGKCGLALTRLEGNFLVLCAAASESVFNILSRLSALQSRPKKEPTVSPLEQTTVVSAIALLLCLIPAYFEEPVQRLSEIGLREWMSLVWYGLFVTALAFVFWYEGIKRCGAFTAAAFSGMMPFTSLLLSVLILGEEAGWQQWVGGLLVMIGMLLIGTADVPVRASFMQHAAFSASKQKGLKP